MLPDCPLQRLDSFAGLLIIKVERKSIEPLIGRKPDRAILASVVLPEPGSPHTMINLDPMSSLFTGGFLMMN